VQRKRTEHSVHARPRHYFDTLTPSMLSAISFANRHPHARIKSIDNRKPLGCPRQGGFDRADLKPHQLYCRRCRDVAAVRPTIGSLQPENRIRWRKTATAADCDPTRRRSSTKRFSGCPRPFPGDGNQMPRLREDIKQRWTARMAHATPNHIFNCIGDKQGTDRFSDMRGHDQGSVRLSSTASRRPLETCHASVNWTRIKGELTVWERSRAPMLYARGLDLVGDCRT